MFHVEHLADSSESDMELGVGRGAPGVIRICLEIAARD